jgi:hypothetical protein
LKAGVHYISLALSLCIIAYLILQRQPSTTSATNPVVATNEVVVSSYKVPNIGIPDEVYFAGERVPIEIPDVRERLDRELHVNTFWHSNTIFLLKRGHRWLSEMEQIIEEHNIPTDLKYLAVIESDLQNKVSPSNAVGFWQLLKGTAQDYGLEVNSEVDERYHPLKSTAAACQYLKKAYARFGSWADAIASYNMGMRGLSRDMERQSVHSYYDLLLNEETSRYVFRAIAIKLIFENPSKYGFHLSEQDLYKRAELESVDVDQTIPDLRDFAFAHGINYKILKRYNPWLRKNRLGVGRGEEYTLLIPKDKDRFIYAPDSAGHMQTEEFSDEDLGQKE